MAAFEETSGFCGKCNKTGTIKRKGTNHIMHFLLSCMTLGLWAIIWLLAVIKFGGWYCPVCESTDVKV